MNALSIIGTGRCLPARLVTNSDFTDIETSDEWIRSRTGIETRYICEGESCTDLAIGAAKKAMERAGVAAQDIGVCIVATLTPQYQTPSTACLLQVALGLDTDTACFDINAACSGFVYALETARAMLQNSDKPYALVVGAEKLSSILDFTDRSTCVLFGDGAGAAVIKLTDNPIYRATLGAKGDEKALYATCRNPDDPYLHMDGSAVFRFAVETIVNIVKGMMDKTGIAAEQIGKIVCHQANSRILETAAKRLGLPRELFYQNLQHYGNTSSASIPIALDELNERGELCGNILCVAFGAGLTWGGVLLTF